MASPAAWLSSAVAAADAATQGLGLQEDITLERATVDGFGTVTYESAPESHKAHVQRKQGAMRTPAGVETSARIMLTFLRPIQIGVHDRITLWDGTTGPIVNPQGGKPEPTTGTPYVRTLYLGAR